VPIEATEEKLAFKGEKEAMIDYDVSFSPTKLSGKLRHAAREVRS
jgi:hypothetical protein